MRTTGGSIALGERKLRLREPIAGGAGPSQGPEVKSIPACGCSTTPWRKGSRAASGT